MNRLCFYWIIFFVFSFINVSFSQQPVSKLGVEQGLSNNTVRSIYQDKKGFLWFGTLDGLNRYDGYGFKIYRNQFGDSNSLVGNMVAGITEDDFGNLWLATRQGVSRLNMLQDNFTTITYKNTETGKTQLLEGEVIKAIKNDGKGNILIATELQGLMLCPSARPVAKQLPLLELGGRKLYKYGVQAICTDPKARILVFVQGRGLCLLDYNRQALVLLNNTVKYVNSLLPDADSVWMATNEGVYSYNPQQNSVTQILSAANGKLNSNLAMSLGKDANGNLYVGTMGGGLNVYGIAKGQMNYLRGGDGRNNLSSNGIYSLFVDKSSRVWLGTQRGGINIIDQGREKFVTTTHEPGNPNSLSGNFVTSICETADSSLLIATEGSGLNLLNRKTGRFTNYKNNPADPTSISSNNVNSVTADYLGNIWVATYTDGICRFDRATGKFRHYTTINQKTGVQNKVFNIFYEDKEKNLWATALRQGNFFGALYRYNRQQDRFELFDDKLSDLFTLQEDSQGNFWGGNITSLVKIDRANRQHQFFHIGQFVRTITDDGLGHLWLGTEGGGLVLFDRVKNEITTRYTSAQGLSNNSIFSALKDDKGQLWLGTFNGLARFDINKRAFKNYYRNDGLESDQFHFNAATRLRSGAFAFGGIKGYNIFFPDSIGILAGTPPLHFTGISVDGSPVEREPLFINSTAGSNILRLKVPYSKAVLAFQFAALEYSVPNKIVYSYFLDGWDKGWTTGNARSATYTHLTEGSYTFRVTSTDGNGEWKNEITLQITVMPPWYRSWWAYLIYIGLAVAAIYLYFRYKARQAKLRYEIDLEKVNVRREKAEREKGEAELAREKAEHEREAAELAKERTERELERSERAAEKILLEKEKEVNEKRLSFFTNISHEYRTPLTLIINPVKDMLEKNSGKTDADNQGLEIVYRNARRMLSLTNQLLLFRKAESGLDEVRPVKLDFTALCYDVFLCFAQQAKHKNIQYSFNAGGEKLELYADRDKMEIILYNLLSNAMKYTSADGAVRMTINESDDKVQVEVTDTGAGISKEAGESIFEKFNQAKGTGKLVKTGFGIGLYLAKQFTEAHHGHIGFHSQPGQGTTFSVSLLKGAAHFLPAQLAGNVDTGASKSLLQEIAVPETLPKQSTANQPQELLEDTSRIITSEKKVILIIDDDAAIREYLLLVFKGPYQLYEADSGETGIALAKKYLPDIVISDIKMGGLSGIEVCKMIKEDSALNHIPVILLTGTSGDELKLEGVKGGADDYIMKPFDKELLIARVNNLLKTRNTLQNYFYNEITLNKQDGKISEQYKEFLERCIQVVEAHLDDDNFNIKTLSAEIGMSYSAVTKKIKAISGQSLNGFIRFIRLRKAARLFIDTDYNVNEVAAQVGIFDAKYFREQFSKIFGMNPSDYIKKYRKPFANKFSVNKDAMEGN